MLLDHVLVHPRSSPLPLKGSSLFGMVSPLIAALCQVSTALVATIRYRAHPPPRELPFFTSHIVSFISHFTPCIMAPRYAACRFVLNQSWPSGRFCYLRGNLPSTTHARSQTGRPSTDLSFN